MRAFDPGKARERLKRHWGYDAFRAGQEAIVRDVASGKDVLVVLPTGGGKSMCYQLPAVLQDGLTVVVSPLIALMEDQAAALRLRGIRAEAIHGSMSFPSRENAWSRVEHGSTSLLYVSPETLAGDLFQSRATRLNIVGVAVDEAHCISEWGHDFRPAYRSIRDALGILGDPPVTAVTATAPPRVRRDIVETLQLKTPAEHVLPIDRPNILWEVIRHENLTACVLEALEAHAGQAVLYAGTRRNAAAWAKALVRAGVAAVPYHAGMDASSRRTAQEQWMSGRARVVTATSAFGMGIDKADVRLVLHTMLPASMEAYYQEAGRAGRDGEQARAILISPDSDDARVRAWAEDRYPVAKVVRRVYDVACDLSGTAVGSAMDRPAVLDVGRIAEVARLRPDRVAAAVSLMESFGIWDVVRPDDGDVRVLIDRETSLDEISGRHPASHPVSKLALALLRAPKKDGLDGFVDISLKTLAEAAQLSQDRVGEGLRYFHDSGWLKEVLSADRMHLRLRGHRSARPDLGDVRVHALRKRALARAEDIIAYANTLDCRRRAIRLYFGERPPARCGACDNCRR